MFESIANSGAAQIFTCPKCQQTINTSLTACNFCGAPVDAAAAGQAAELMGRVNQACNDASYLKVMAIGAPVAFVVSLLPIVGLLGALGLIFICFAVPLMSLRWWVKFKDIDSDESDFRRARGRVLGISVVSVIYFLVGLIELVGMFHIMFGH